MASSGCVLLLVARAVGSVTPAFFWIFFSFFSPHSPQVIDSADRMRLEDCKAELRVLLTEEVCACCRRWFLLVCPPLTRCLCCFRQRLAGASLLILANKQDLPGALTAEQIREVGLVPWPVALSHRWLQVLELDAIVSHHWKIQGCSAVTGENLLEGMDWVVDDIASRIYLND